MNKYLATLFLTVLFAVPFVSQAATLEEQKTAILSQIIHLLQTQIADLQAQLDLQEATKHLLGATASTTEATTTPSFFTCTYSKDPSGQSHRSCGG